MKSIPGTLVGTLLLLAAGVCSAPAQTPPLASEAKIRNHFDSDEVLRAPAFFDFTVLGEPGQASWKVLIGVNPPSPPNVVSQVRLGRPVHSIAAAVRRSVSYRDGSWSVALQRGSGRGGMVFRMAGEKDFRVLLIDLVTGEAILTAYQGGRPAELGRANAELTNPWGTLSIIADGPRISALWDGKSLLDASDPSPKSGRVGLATAGTGKTSFDEFLLERSDR